MSLPRAFIAVWATAYICCALRKKISNVSHDRLIFPAFGLTIALNLFILRNLLLYLILGIVEVLGGVMSFLGVIKWKLAWMGSSGFSEGFGGVAQVVMAMADLMAATFLFVESGVFM